MTGAESFSDLFASEAAALAQPAEPSPWTILVVDDEPDIRAVYRMALEGVWVEGRPLRLLEAASALEAKSVLAGHPEIALILLDVVMESELAGLDLVHYIRQDLKNRTTQIQVVTGQPGYAPQRHVVTKYDINGYLLKSELTADRIFQSTCTGLRAYRLLQEIEAMRHQSELQRDLLKKSNDQLEQYAYIASHDLRQPVRTIINYLRLIEKSLSPDTGDDLKKYFNFVINSARRLDSLIIGLLEYSTVGHKPEPFTLVCLADPVVESLANLSLAITESKAEIDVAGDLPTISGNRQELSRLLQNLVSNAIKYRHPQRPPRISIGSDGGNGSTCRFWVTDNGTGIPMEQRERVFGIFQRLVPRDSCEGIGIGLTMVKKIVENHDGRIWIEDADGGGCRFMMEFPRPPGI